MSKPTNNPEYKSKLPKEVLELYNSSQKRVIYDSGYDWAAEHNLMIIGLGAIGLGAALAAYSMAPWRQITIVDADHIEQKNLCNQGYEFAELTDPPTQKVTAVEARLRRIFGPLGPTTICPINAWWSPDNVGVADVTLLAVDKIEIREQIFRYIQKQRDQNAAAVQFMGDIRMAGFIGQVLTATEINGCFDTYSDTLFKKNEASTGACSDASLRGPSMMLTGALIIELARFLNGQATSPHKALEETVIYREMKTGFSDAEAPAETTTNTARGARPELVGAGH